MIELIIKFEMKAFFILILIFSVFLDVSQVSVHVEPLSLKSFYEKNNLEFDFHSSSDEQNHDAHHNFCHLGHSHTMIKSWTLVNFLIHSVEVSLYHPAFAVGKIRHHFSEINRPPIA